MQGRLSAHGSSVEDNAQQTAVVDVVLEIAEETGASAIQVSLARLRRRAARAQTALIPIVGPRSRAHLDEYLRALDLELSGQQYQRLAGPYLPVS